jgi:5,5'-dehydrodivanillate O-demethylase oxygenase subunit
MTEASMATGVQPKVDKRFLHQTAADTLMGQLLRRFWHPVALSTDLKAGSACPIRVLGENLTLYRGKSGRPYLIGGRCAHRCSVLHTGVIDDEQLRCMYHGWRYNGDGVCTDMPAEKKQRPTEIKIAGYPAHEYCGLIFAYLGQQPVPEFDLPRKEVFEEGRRFVFAKREVWDCNWFQQVENSLDAVHLSFAHLWGSAEQFGMMAASGGEIPELAYSETSSGVRQIATRSNGNVRISDWTFPNNNHIVVPGPNKNDPWPHVSVWAVPADDTHTMRFRLCSLQEDDPANRETIERSQKFDPSQHAEKLFRGDLTGITDQALISSQDYVAVRGQGEIVDRTQENLSSSDLGVVFLRRVFLRELEAIQNGQPTKQWARPSESLHLPSPPAQAAE